MSDRWRDRAECRGHPVGWWFPTNADYAWAKVLCDRCPVRLDCLIDSVSQDADDYGMFGGLTPGERWVWKNHYRKEQR